MLEIPESFVRYQKKFFAETAESWLTGMPALVESYVDRWRLSLDTGALMHGMTALVVPVLTSDGTPAVLKLQQFDPESAGEPQALQAWAGDGAVRLLAHDGEIMLLERLDFSRHLSALPDPLEATQIIAQLLARLNAHRAPDGIRLLSDEMASILDRVPAAAAKLPAGEARLLSDWAARVKEVTANPGDQLLHWDLHFDNVLASDREPWLAIDPKPLSGTTAFELLPALDNRWDAITATGDVDRAIRKRFDLMTEVLGLDRAWATTWTLARVVQNLVWFTEDGEETIEPVQLAIATALTSR